MLRTILIPEDTHIQFDVPAEFIGRQVEITFMPLDEMSAVKVNMSDFWGVLSDETADELHNDINKSREEWERDI